MQEHILDKHIRPVPSNLSSSTHDMELRLDAFILDVKAAIQENSDRLEALELRVTMLESQVAR